MHRTPRHAAPGNPLHHKTPTEIPLHVMVARARFLAVYHHGPAGAARALVMRGRNGSRVRQAARIVLNHL